MDFFGVEILYGVLSLPHTLTLGADPHYGLEGIVLEALVDVLRVAGGPPVFPVHFHRTFDPGLLKSRDPLLDRFDKLAFAHRWENPL